MRWEDERYVRVYTRDTPDWVALGWEAHALFLLVLRRCDRAGIVPMGRSGVRGLAAMLVMPLEVVERALPILVEDGCIEMHEGALVVRNFLAAQEALASDVKRQRDKRERDRERARGQGDLFVVTERDATVTQRDDASRGSGGPSRAVTPSRAVPNHAEPTPDARARAKSNGDATDPDEAPPDGESGVRPVATTSRKVTNATDDACFGMAVKAWAEGVTKATGRAMTNPSPGEQRRIVEAINAHGPPASKPEEREAWARASGEGYARAAAGSAISVFGYVRWLDSGSPPAFGRRAAAAGVQPAPAKGRHWRANE